MVRLFGISGSLRQDSYNAALLRTAARLLPEGATLEIGTIAGIPLYDGDIEAAEGIPEPVRTLKAKIAGCDGLLLASPEYNNSIPGVFKNAIDWASRPSSEIAATFGGKPTAIMGASLGNFGTILSQNAWLPVLRTLGCDTWNGGRMLVSGAGKAFAHGALADTLVEERLQAFLGGFVSYVAARKASRTRA
jgi:NAD(P)H-dependent FMN reductase